MRILVIHEPTSDCIDGIRLDLFRPGSQYEVGHTLAALFIAEGWAEPALEEADGPTFAIALPDVAAPREPQSNLVRETFPPYYDAADLAADRRHVARQRPGRRS